jgi:peptidoglycan/xylan/chitin deacetylase (PgdA/CDA1 family)
MHHLRQAVRHILVWTLYVTGFTWWLARRRLRGRILVLTYHRVLPADEQRASFSSHSIVVSPRAFERQLRFLRKHFRMLTVDEFVSAVASGKPAREPSCLITFDDGWFDNLRYAEPILTKLQVPAVVFVATGYVGTDKCFWQERLGRLLDASWRNASGAAVLTKLDAPAPADLDDHEATRNWIRVIIDRLKHRPPQEVSQLVDELEAQLPSTRANHPDRFMSWDDVVQLAGSGYITIASHAHSHRPLTELDGEEIAAELTRSRAEIERRLGREVTTIAYPNGNHDDQVVAAARSCGYVAGFTTIAGRYAPGEDAFRVKRVNIHERGARSAPGFLSRVIGLM